MSKKVLLLFGSPRKNGNTSIATKWFIEGAEANGTKVEVIDANSLQCKYHGCIACMSCQKSEKRECVIKDDVSEVGKMLPEFNAFVVATPVYYFGPTAQVKVVLDRLFALDRFDLKTSEHIKEHNPNCNASTIGLIATSGGPYEMGLNLVDNTFKMLSNFTGDTYKSLLVPLCGFNTDRIVNRKDVREQAIALGKHIVDR